MPEIQMPAFRISSYILSLMAWQIRLGELGIRADAFTLPGQGLGNERGKYGDGNLPENRIFLDDATQGESVQIGHFDIADNALHKFRHRHISFPGFLPVLHQKLQGLFPVLGLSDFKAAFLLQFRHTQDGRMLAESSAWMIW